MSYAFIGDYFLQPYIDRFDIAVNQAAAQYKLRSDNQSEHPGMYFPDRRPKHYSLMRAKNVGYTAILLFAKDSTRILDIKEAEVGFGAAAMGNKGAAGLRVIYDVEGKSTELTFVATHLAAMEWNLSRRNANWASIMSSMTFGDPSGMVSGQYSMSLAGDTRGEGERGPLLHDDDVTDGFETLEHLHEVSIFKPSSFLFVGGDLNYRISTTSPPPDATFPSLEEGSEDYYPKFFELDQLTKERLAGRTLHGMTEAQVRFPPTYKYEVKPASNYNDEDMAPVQYEFAPHRYPSWTDRILYLDIPDWVKRSNKSARIQVRSYDAMPVVRTSDHRPVFLRVSLPMLAPTDLAPPPSLQTVAARRDATDPRLRLPVEIDVESWARRRAARNRELVVGWSTFLWSTREGACILGTVLAACLGSYWLYRVA